MTGRDADRVLLSQRNALQSCSEGSNLYECHTNATWNTVSPLGVCGGSSRSCSTMRLTASGRFVDRKVARTAYMYIGVHIYM